MTRNVNRNSFVIQNNVVAGPEVFMKCDGITWDRVVDVVVVGLGAAGSAAAIEAFDNGAEVLVLEKDSVGGGNTRLSGGTLRRIVDVDGATQYYAAVNDETVSLAMNRRLVEGIASCHAWFEEKCDAMFVESAKIMFPPAPHVIWDFLPGAEGMGGRSQFVVADPVENERNGGHRMFLTLMQGITKRNIEILYNMGGKRLLQNSGGEVVGLLAQSPDGKERLAIKTRKGVILCCGGFHKNTEMQINYLSMPYLQQGCTFGDGDGIVMTQEIGAKMWHMTGVSCGISYLVEGYDIPIGIGVRTPHYFYVDQTGKRFLNETGMDVHAMAFDFTATNAEKMSYPRMPSYLIFDEHVRTSGSMLGQCSGKILDDPTFSWSADNKAEIEKGWIKMAYSVAELGRQLGYSEGVLEKAVGDYNRAALTGYDPDFKRDAFSMKPLDQPPYYAIEVWPALLNTQGGPQRDEEARVLNVDNEPIPRLFSAGELGSMLNKFYPGGTNITEAIVFGRIAGENAAKLPPLE